MGGKGERMDAVSRDEFKTIAAQVKLFLKQSIMTRAWYHWTVDSLNKIPGPSWHREITSKVVIYEVGTLLDARFHSLATRIVGI